MRPRILTLSRRYLPGYKAGGPIRTLASMAERLGGDFCFKVVTSDRDSGSHSPYPGVRVNQWQPVGKAEVIYLSPQHISLPAMRGVLCATDYDVMYLNSFFSPHFTIKPLLLRRLGQLPRKPLIVAPRGEFSPGALALKPYRKQTFLALAKALDLYGDALWQASSEYEEQDIRRHFGSHVGVQVAPDLAMAAEPAGAAGERPAKTPGSLKMLFLSRIVPKKNLLGALRLLEGLPGDIRFDIYGPQEDPAYWRECERAIRRLPRNIDVRYQGVVPPDEVTRVMGGYHLFFFPTLGENFGHVILEALIAGCPLLISDQTPWRGLEQQSVGWDLPLDAPDAFRAVLRRCLAIDAAELRSWSQRAREMGARWSRDEGVEAHNRTLFWNACAPSQHKRREIGDQGAVRAHPRRAL